MILTSTIIGLYVLLIIVYYILLTMILIDAIKRKKSSGWKFILILGYFIIPLGFIVMIVYWFGERKVEEVKEKKEEVETEVEIGKIRVKVKGKKEE